MKRFDYVFRVHAGDTDYAGLMYHANYVDFFERARVEWFNHLSIDLAEWARKKIFFPVATLSIDYLRPVFFNDALVIKSEIVKAGRVSLVFGQSMFKENDVVSEIRVKIGCVNEAYKPISIPSNIQEILEYE